MWKPLSALVLVPFLYGATKYDLEKEVANPFHVSVAEYKKIQNCLALITDEDLPPMKSNRHRLLFNTVRFVGDTPEEIPIFQTIHLNGKPNDRKNCIVLYATYNKPYPENVVKVISALKNIGFDGHLVYRIGGYPNIEGGSLKMVDVPYAFKACALEEAHLLGYQNLLWLDSALTPLKNLKPLFEKIEKEGYFALDAGGSIQLEVDHGYVNSQALAAMGVSYEDSALVRHIAGPTFGVNMNSDIGREILRRLYSMAEQRSPIFFCDWADEVVLSAILYQMKLPTS